MKLTVFNGSPKGKNGNTEIFIKQFVAGFLSFEGNKAEEFYLKNVGKVEEFREAFSRSERVLLAFPLYADAMPGNVKAFIEALEPLCGREGNPTICFLVQSGFPEGTHSRHIEKYLEKLAGRLGCPYTGTIVKGNGGGITTQPPFIQRKIFAAVRELGRSFGRNEPFDQKVLDELASPERYPRWMVPIVAVRDVPFINLLYWAAVLRKNGVYKQRSARPYEE
ncbi:MAG: hypothetical protein JXA25_20575 [Anaerolineales bacterium]|nr:hypothetical protein [Anaerolineales bacterium]